MTAIISLIQLTSLYNTAWICDQHQEHLWQQIIFPDTIPLLNPKPPKFSSSQTYALFHKIKKGSNAYRKVLDRDIDFINYKRLKAWRNATGDNNVNEDSLRNTFKLANEHDIPAGDHDALVRILTRKTTMNCQNHKVYPIQAERPEWAHNLNCWACKTKLGIFNIETLRHALQSCPCLTDIRKETLCFIV